MTAEVRECWARVLRGACDADTSAAVRKLSTAGLTAALRVKLLSECDSKVAAPAAAEICSAIAYTGKDSSFPAYSIASDSNLTRRPQDASHAESLSIATQTAFDIVLNAAKRAQWVEIAVIEESKHSKATIPTHCGGSLGYRYIRRCRALLAELVPPLELSLTLCRVFKESFEEFGDESMRDVDEIDESLRAMCAKLIALGFMPAVQDAIGWVVFDEIDAKVKSAAASRLGDRVLPRLRNWVDRAVMPWLEAVLSAAPNDPDDLLSGQVCENGAMRSITIPQKPSLRFHGKLEHGTVSISQWRKRLAFHLHETLATVRIEQMLQLVAFYPKSFKALQDLKESLLCTDKKSHLVSSLRDQFSIELLHAGTMTSDILQQYVNMIKALRFLDPAGVILEHVGGPVRNCLRKRPDTVRCIVSGMTGDGDLFEELERGRSKSARFAGDENAAAGTSSSALIVPIGADEDASDAGDNSEGESLDEQEFANWEPEPIDAPPRQGRWKPGGDAIATLVAIYGSSERIVNEYRALLADKLVSHFDVDIERESRILGLLQQRFGVEAMHDCVIMLKDMRDSRVSLATARAEAPAVARQLESFEATVVSKEFWPKLADEPSFKAPGELSKLMGLFQASFERVKDPRKLRWMHGLGVAKLNIAFEDGRELSLNVTPFQAAIVMRFAENPRWTVKELQQVMEVSDEAALRRRLVLLANQDVIRATDSSASSYEAIERAEDLDSSGGVADGDADSEGGDGEEGENDEEEGMGVYEPFIIAMLRNLKQLPLDRIHSMLQMVGRSLGYDKTQTQLAAFLAQMVADEKIILAGGMYKVV